MSRKTKFKYKIITLSILRIKLFRNLDSFDILLMNNNNNSNIVERWMNESCIKIYIKYIYTKAKAPAAAAPISPRCSRCLWCFSSFL